MTTHDEPAASPPEEATMIPEQATPELPTPPVAGSKNSVQPSGRELLRWLVKTRFARVVVWLLALAVAGLSGAFFEEIYDYSRSKPTFRPYVAVVASKEAIDFPIPTEFLRGFQDGAPEGRTYIEDRDKRQIDIRTLEDLGSTDEAARIANELVNDDNCILVIGNSNSTLTAVTLDIFLTSANPPSYILPIATSNDLITKARSANHRAVLRMVPDNASQADVVQRLASSLAPGSRVAIYSDQENTTYSLDLSRDVASRVRKKGGHVVIEEAIGPTNSVLTSIAVLRGDAAKAGGAKADGAKADGVKADGAKSDGAAKGGAGPDVIVYVGVAHHALLLIDQLGELGVTVPIIFTDGCMVGSLIENISRIPNRAFVLSPVGTTASASQMPTYEPVGKDAYTLASKILNACTNCNRARLRELISTTKDRIEVANGDAGQYRFNADGNNIAMTYKVYEITGGKLRLNNYP